MKAGEVVVTAITVVIVFYLLVFIMILAGVAFVVLGIVYSIDRVLSYREYQELMRYDK